MLFLNAPENLRRSIPSCSDINSIIKKLAHCSILQILSFDWFKVAKVYELIYLIK